MDEKPQRRLSGDEVRALMLANAKTLMSEPFLVPAPAHERHGQRQAQDTRRQKKSA
ncbi:hypothetical protein [Kalamiella sp. sgz302252]|uniref:hypothetical protein n=1 Tax=Pantoea sp. sgz302252 TaxID=3341827 RepID=UPI0036D2DAE0